MSNSVLTFIDMKEGKRIKIDRCVEEAKIIGANMEDDILKGDNMYKEGG